MTDDEKNKLIAELNDIIKSDRKKIEMYKNLVEKQKNLIAAQENHIVCIKEIQRLSDERSAAFMAQLILKRLPGKL